jgi:type IV pilus assembly protein PilN
MTQINLLPWREQARQFRKILFGIVLGGCIVMSIFMVFFIHFYLKIQNDIQIERNAYLQAQIDQEQTYLDLLKAQQIIRDKIISELNLIINLRKKSYSAVSVLNLLLKATPGTVLIEKLSREGKIFSIEGLADSDLETTLFMRNIQAVTGFNQPELNVIKTQKSVATNDANDEIDFILKVEPKDN